MREKIFLGADHAGFALKEKIKTKLQEQGLVVEDLGNDHWDPADDFPDFAFAVAERVAQEKGRGILFCASGVGMCIAANKVRGIRAVNASNRWLALHSRRDDNTNILCLPAAQLTEKEAAAIINLWLKTPFSKEKRFRRRLKKIEQREGK